MRKFIQFIAVYILITYSGVTYAQDQAAEQSKLGEGLSSLVESLGDLQVIAQTSGKLQNLDRKELQDGELGWQFEHDNRFIRQIEANVVTSQLTLLDCKTNPDGSFCTERVAAARKRIFELLEEWMTATERMWRKVDKYNAFLMQTDPIVWQQNGMSKEEIANMMASFERQLKEIEAFRTDIRDHYGSGDMLRATLYEHEE